MTVLLFGGTGFVGKHILSKLLNEGITVILIVRKRQNGLPTDVIQIEGDLLEGKEPNIDGYSIDACINCVGIIQENYAKKVTFERIHVTFVEMLLQFLYSHAIKRIIHISALGTRPNAVSSYHKTKYEAEELIKGSTFSYTIFRPSLLFGDGNKSITLFQFLIKTFHTMLFFEHGKKLVRPLLIDDLAAFVALSLTTEQTFNQIYEVGGPQEFTYISFCNEIANASKTFYIPFYPPKKITLTLLHLDKKLSLLPLSYDQALMLCEDNTCDLAFKTIFEIQLSPLTL